jgi:uncharacterized Zn finger protein
MRTSIAAAAYLFLLNGTAANLLAQTCTCPDYETRGLKCKHLWAAE